MNLIVLFEPDFVGGTNRVHLRGRRRQHVCDVQHAQVGDALRVGLLNDRLGTGVLTAVTPEVLEMDVTLDHAPPPALPVTLLLA
ncbi:MAG TPA: hypothetical protein VN812_03275, partial [Candidatus Acidoferrales bacterium]|nr:hypothetical protein [Candidatus Acidoferrales bacterium]